MKRTTKILLFGISLVLLILISIIFLVKPSKFGIENSLKQIINDTKKELQMFPTLHEKFEKHDQYWSQLYKNVGKLSDVSVCNRKHPENIDIDFDIYETSCRAVALQSFSVCHAIKFDDNIITLFKQLECTRNVAKFSKRPLLDKSCKNFDVERPYFIHYAAECNGLAEMKMEPCSDLFDMPARVTNHNTWEAVDCALNIMAVTKDSTHCVEANKILQLALKLDANYTNLPGYSQTLEKLKKCS